MPTATSVQAALSRANAGATRSYWALSRAPRYSVLFAIPLLIAYEALAAILSTGNPSTDVRNGADVLLKSVFVTVAGARGPLVFAVCLIGLSIWVVARDMRRNRGPLRTGVFAGMMGESVVLALLFGVVVGTITAKLLQPFAITLAQTPMQELGFWRQLMISLGAGLYEELLFRVVLVSALLLLFQRAAGWSRTVAAVAATILGALIFSAAHYVGRYGDPFEVQSFVYRAIGGLAFSALYVTRGFGITAWTHALYDVFLLVR